MEYLPCQRDLIQVPRCDWYDSLIRLLSLSRDLGLYNPRSRVRTKTQRMPTALGHRPLTNQPGKSITHCHGQPPRASAATSTVTAVGPIMSRLGMSLTTGCAAARLGLTSLPDAVHAAGPATGCQCRRLVLDNAKRAFACFSALWCC